MAKQDGNGGNVPKDTATPPPKKKSVRTKVIERVEKSPVKAISLTAILGVLGGLLLAGATELVKVGVNAFAKPKLEVMANAHYLNKDSAEEWTAIYWSPKLSKDATRPSTQASVAELDHEKGNQNWKANLSKDDFAADILEDGYHFSATGLKKNETVVVGFRGDEVGRGTYYLTKHPTYDYYFGVAILCDCQSPKPHSLMACPYVLYKTNNSSQREHAREDPLVATANPGEQKRCVTLDPANLPQSVSAVVTASK